jgi:prophage antirepressor-like protein
MQHDDGSTWWVATELCAAVHIRNVSQACSRLDDDEKDTICFTDSEGRPHELLIISESGLYKLLMRSNKEEAKSFQRWVTHEVLPQIRKTGTYSQASAVDRFPELQAIIQLVQSTAEAKLLAEKAQQTADEANAKARLALHGQQWVTIRQYVSIYELEHQVPRRLQQEYGRYLTGLCQQRGAPVYLQRVVEGWEENTYPITVIQETLGPWIGRRGGDQGNLHIVQDR